MDEKLAIQSYNQLLKTYKFYMEMGNMEKAGQVLHEMAELGNKCPQLAKLINSSELGTAMAEVGFTATETNAAVAVIESAGVAGGTVETGAGGTAVVTTATSAGGTGLSGVLMTVGGIIAIGVVLGVAAFAIYQFFKKSKEKKERADFANFARRALAAPKLKLKPAIGRL